MTVWIFNKEPAPRDPISGWLLVDGMQYPPNWPREELEALGLTWSPPPPSVAQALKALADRRWWKAQTFVYDGVTTQAEPARAKVASILQGRRRRGTPSEETQTFKLANGEYRQWSEAQIEAFGFAVADHEQACFDREAELSAQIIAAEDPSSVDTSQGWPD